MTMTLRLAITVCLCGLLFAVAAAAVGGTRTHDLVQRETDKVRQEMLNIIIDGETFLLPLHRHDSSSNNNNNNNNNNRWLQSGNFSTQDNATTSDVDTNTTTTNATSDAPTTAPYVSDWLCQLSSDGYYVCVGPRPAYFDDGLPATVNVYYVCSVDLSAPELQNAQNVVQDYCLDTPTIAVYGLCLMIDTETGDSCAGCNVLPSGQVAYNCQDLYGNVSACASRNDRHECTTSHTPWFCIRNTGGRSNGQGYLCNPFQSGALVPATEFMRALPVHVSQQLVVQLWCDHPVFGRYTLNQCGSQFCTLSAPPGTEQFKACSICRLLPDKVLPDVVDDTLLVRGENILAYDCARDFPGVPCVSTDVEGQCLDGSVLAQDRLASAESCAYLTSTKTSSANYNTQGDNEEGFWTISWQLLNIEPRTFNIVSSLIALLTRALAGLCIAVAYPILLSWFLQRPKNKGAPLPVLEASRGGLFTTAQMVVLAKGAMPTVVLLLALALAEFSHPLADVGFDFVQVNLQGDAAPVLSLRTEHRNPNRPMDTMGDPIGLRTYVQREIDGLDPNRRIPVLPITANSFEVDSYMEAVLLAASGGSPFITKFAGSSVPRSSIGGVANFSVKVGIPCDARPGQPPLPLTSIPLEIPVSCEQGTNDAMIRVPQIITGLALYDEPLRHVASIPNCTLTGTRSSGIFTDSSTSMETAQVLEVANSDIFDFFDLPIDLIVNGSLTKTFFATPDDKKLSRDRTDWRQGRRIQGIEGVQVGNKTIGFSTVILTSGQPVVTISTTFTEEVESPYRLFARLNDTCPDRPSGYASTSDTVCFAFMEMDCEPFQEDSDLSSDLVFVSSDTSQCTGNFKAFRLVWGQNFAMDDELLATIAGIYGVIRPTLYETAIARFSSNGVLAAIFALGSLVERPSIKQVVRPQINLLYVIAMILPLILCLCCLAVIALLYSKRLTIPSTAYELMVFGRENPKIPTRRSKRDRFADKATKFSLFYGPSESGNGSNALIVLTKTDVKASVMLRNSDVREVPVDLSSGEFSQTGQVGAATDATNQNGQGMEENDIPRPFVNATTALLSRDEEVGSSANQDGASANPDNGPASSVDTWSRFKPETTWQETTSFPERTTTT